MSDIDIRLQVIEEKIDKLTEHVTRLRINDKVQDWKFYIMIILVGGSAGFGGDWLSTILKGLL